MPIIIKPPNKEEDLVGKRFAVVYQGQRTATLSVAKIGKRFLQDTDGEVDKLMMMCLKPKVGMGSILEGTPKCLPPDQGMFDPWYVIYGPMEAIQLGANKFDVPKYQDAKACKKYEPERHLS